MQLKLVNVDRCFFLDECEEADETSQMCPEQCNAQVCLYQEVEMQGAVIIVHAHAQPKKHAQ